MENPSNRPDNIGQITLVKSDKSANLLCKIDKIDNSIKLAKTAIWQNAHRQKVDTNLEKSFFKYDYFYQAFSVSHSLVLYILMHIHSI